MIAVVSAIVASVSFVVSGVMHLLAGEYCIGAIYEVGGVFWMLNAWLIYLNLRR